MVNNWHIVEGKLQAATATANLNVDVLLVDLRTKRGESVVSLDPDDVFRKTALVEREAVRATLAGHPFLYNRTWCKQVGVAVKQAIKQRNGQAGCCCIFAYGDAAIHGPDQDEHLPDFYMNVAQYFSEDLRLIAEHNLRGQRVALEVARRKEAIAAETERRKAEAVAVATPVE